MDAKLRIGNIINSLTDKRAAVVEEISKDIIVARNFYGFNVKSHFRNESGMKKIEGIEINERYANYFGLLNSKVEVKGNYYYIRQMSDEENNIQWAFYKNNDQIRLIKYVHQLQNVFFEATGNDLPVDRHSIFLTHLSPRDGLRI